LEHPSPTYADLARPLTRGRRKIVGGSLFRFITASAISTIEAAGQAGDGEFPHLSRVAGDENGARSRSSRHSLRAV
jgi:hypothetical protein